MKVLMISSFPPMRAPEADHAFHLCEHLANRGLNVEVLTARGNIQISHPRITVHPIMRDWSWLELPRFGRLLKQCSPEAVLLIYMGWTYKEHPMITFAPTIAKTLLTSVRFVTLFENADYFEPPWRRSYLKRAMRKGAEQWAGAKNVDYRLGTLLRDSDSIIVPSELARSILTGFFSGVKSKSVLIPTPPIIRMTPEDSGSGRLQQRKKIGAKAEDFLIAYFGYIYAGKGIETLLKAFELASRRRNHLRLVMVGGSIDFPHQPSYPEKMYALSKEMGLDDKVTWTGEYAWDSDTASSWLRAADICVLPFDAGVSLNNSSFGAAAAHGLPIITTQGETLEPPFIHKENVLLCAPKNPETMATAIETLMDNPELRRRLHQGALGLAQEWFSWDKAIDRTIATFS